MAIDRGGAKNRVCRGGTKPRQPGRRENCVSRGERKKKTRLPGQARVRHHRENCGKQTWRSSEWAASQAQPKSAKSEPCQPGRRKNRVSRGGAKTASAGAARNRVSRGGAKTASAGAARKPRQPGRAKRGGGGEPRLPGRKKKKRVCRGEPGCGTTGKTVANRHGDRVSGPPARLSPKSAKSELRQPGRRENRVCRGGTKPRQPGRRENCVSRGEPGCGTTGKTVANRHGDRVSGPPARHSRKVLSPNCVSRGGKNRVSRGGAKNRVCRGGTKPRQPGRRENCVSRGERKKNASAGASPGAAPPGKLWQTDMAIE
ncbi:hypothetical protein MRX96_049929 [Rhipicephalus microplus]